MSNPASLYQPGVETSTIKCPTAAEGTCFLKKSNGFHRADFKRQGSLAALGEYPARSELWKGDQATVPGCNPNAEWTSPRMDLSTTIFGFGIGWAQEGPIGAEVDPMACDHQRHEFRASIVPTRWLKIKANAPLVTHDKLS